MHSDTTPLTSPVPFILSASLAKREVLGCRKAGWGATTQIFICGSFPRNSSIAACMESSSASRKHRKVLVWHCVWFIPEAHFSRGCLTLWEVCVQKCLWSSHWEAYTWYPDLSPIFHSSSEFIFSSRVLQSPRRETVLKLWTTLPNQRIHPLQHGR